MDQDTTVDERSPVIATDALAPRPQVPEDGRGASPQDVIGTEDAVAASAGTTASSPNATTQELLPLCDVLFNIISLASYFCDVVFDVMVAYTLLAVRRQPLWFGISLSCILGSLATSQVLSLRWYLDAVKAASSGRRRRWGVLALHALQAGVLWRYFKLLLPVRLSAVKREVADLCLLRLVHAFGQATPMLLLQLHLAWAQPSADLVAPLDRVSLLLSLFSVCWALASFSKNVRRRQLHRLVLTWLGVVCQLAWRLGTVSARVVALTLYAALYGPWVLAVLVLHWLAMLVWLASPPRRLFGGEVLWRRLAYCALLAYLHTLCYVNLRPEPGRARRAAFYVAMLLENSLLAAVWLALHPGPHWGQSAALLTVWGGFFLGLGFMLLYYRCCHVRRLAPVPRAAPPVSPAGVFNCRLNPAALKRKRKKPSSFVPPAQPFWKRGPGAPPAVDIQQKLQEKRRQQLQDLLAIEEEMKQGKLAPRGPPQGPAPRQPIPRSKKQPWLRSPPQFRYRSLLGGSPEVLLCPHRLDQARGGGPLRAAPPLARTLPRELRWAQRALAFRESNSSDGDVDSADEDASARLRSCRTFLGRPHGPETRL
ncbi:conserved hypothetical protein [Ixodes scapularis]|uniref:XK-related protein n=1 Tax=Ixodes scapularis TaxID=6945 RepID=B7QC88_IXOSC|nr:conserved hypothetical protein [Ixodes scapularis]|eukprot:XP_002413152.1 conserved hypothetical protein [Ixodes scapularis]